MQPTPHARPLWTRFLVFLGPLVLTNVLQALAGTITTIYLGQLLGARALAAAVSFFPLFMCCIGFVIGLGAGASILIGQAWGAREPDKVRRVAGTVLVGALALSCIVAGVGELGIAPLMRALGTPADVLPDSIAYARVLLLALPALFLHLLSAAVLRGLGDSVTPLRALLVASSVWVALTPAFILGWLGLPRLGVTSAAWASLCGNSAAVAWLGWHLHRKQHMVAFGALRPYFHFNGPLLKTVARLGIPTGLFFITSSAADVGMLSLVNRHGSQATAAWGAVNQVMAYVQFPAMSIAIASSVFAAQAIGARQLAEVDHVTRVGLWLNLLLTGGLAVVAALAAPFAVALFLKDGAIIALASSLLHITVWGSIAFGMASVFTAVMRAAGTVRVPTSISLGCIALLLFPFAWSLENALGLQGIWVAYPLTYACALVLQTLYFYGVWKRRPIARLV
ncbi:MATE family efflux transporter [Ramlibacter sp. G-1-2-2]|uniref:MATE family efflux transporter n=1 Tax=Ramlibacter agri TaxID=2728837 RepID=A0A848GWA5_9BURK|nr:MATE family efflux transporter [Ramlibacter agri]NML42936.1 MATE family efflux transporter [Ramlibacter agri]